MFPTPYPTVGSSGQRFSNPYAREASSATGTPILPIRLHLSAGLRCALPRRELSIVHFAKPTESDSALSKSWVRSRLRSGLRRQPPIPTGTLNQTGQGTDSL